MNAQKTQRVQLFIEELEPRYAPAYLISNPGAFSVAGLTFPGLDDGWNVQCRTSMSTGAFLAPDGLPQIDVLDQYTEILAPLQSPNEQDFQLLVNEFPDWNFRESPLQLADNSLQIKDYEALAAGSGAPAGNVGASLLLHYNPTGVDPTGIDWIQFVSTNAPLGTDPPLIIDNAGADGMSPFYNRGGGTAGDTGFFDVPSRLIRNDPIQWHADLFVAQEVAPENGHRTVVLWGGVSWGWQTVRLPVSPIVAVSSSADSSEIGSPTASVSTDTTDGSNATAAVDSSSDGALLGTGTLDDSGPASVDATGPTVGAHDVQAVSSGDGKSTSGTASASQVVTDATSPVVTDATSPVVTDGTGPVVTDATSPVVTDAMGPVATDATNPVVTDATNQDMGPRVTILSPGDQTNQAGDSVNLSLTASASNGSPLTYSSTVQPVELTMTDGTISGAIDPSGGSSTVYSAAVAPMNALGNSDTLSWTVS